MKYSARIAASVLAASSFSTVFAQTQWCGKNYMSNQTVVPPGGQFQLPASSQEPLVAFRCSPAFRPYLEEDAKNAIIVVDAPIVYQYIQGASPVSLSSSGSSPADCGTLDVTISIGNQVFATQQVPLNTTGSEICLDLSSLKAQKTGYNVTCSATYQADTSSTTQEFSASTTLLYLPDNQGSVVKTDLRTGTLLARPANGSGGDFQPFIPQGFYVSFDSALAKNLTYIDQLKLDGFNTIHAIPPYDNATLFQQVLDKTLELGLYFVYDLRSSYQNLTALAQLVETYSSLPNLLLWETAHEPDGNEDPVDAARTAYDLIYQLDGYHPVSIVLNCHDYNFAPYVEGADIVLGDVYPIGMNATYSVIWDTECTPDFGRCGCDDCKGFVYDITARVQTFKNRFNILGYDRSKAVWGTPQAFGSGAYWDTTPTGQEWAGMALTAFTHGATGSMSFQYPTVSGNETTIEGTAPALNSVVDTVIEPFLVNAGAVLTHEAFNIGGVDVGLWFNGTAYLFLGTNLGSGTGYVPWGSIGLNTVTSNDTWQVQRIFSVTQNTNITGFNFRPYGIGIYTVTPPA
jgi:hypothetical protein